MKSEQRGDQGSDYSIRRRLNGGRRHGEAEQIGTGNRERRQERIRELIHNANDSAASRGYSQPELEHQGGAEGPYGTRIYNPPPPEWEQRPDGAWVEEWKQPADKDPELEWKRSSRWKHMEEAGGRPYATAPELDEGGSRFPGQGEGGASGFRRDLQAKLLLSAVLFGAVWGMFQLTGDTARQGQAIVTEALTEEMDFSLLAGWYEQTFAGAPSFIPGFARGADPQPVSSTGSGSGIVSPLENGSVVHSFAELLGGVEMAGEPGETVRAAQKGRVQLVSSGDANGPTIVIQHPGDRTTYYGQLGEADVKANDWVDAGQPIGKLGQPDASGGSALLYFAVKEKDRYIDPADVVPFD